MGLDPNIWGPQAWFFLHSIALTYPESPTEIQKQNYKTFFESLQNVLPCLGCQNHYSNNLKDTPIGDNLDDNKKLNKWLIEMHNKVNKLNNKPTMEYKEYLDYYKNIYSNPNNIKNPYNLDTIKSVNNNSNFNNNYILIFIAILIIIIIGSIVYYNYNKNII